MIRKRTTLTTTERKQRLFCMLFAWVLLGAAWGIVMLRWQYDGAPAEWSSFLGMDALSQQAVRILRLADMGVARL